jgi:hypothetical protein
MSYNKHIPIWAPGDLTDGREPLDWESKYTDKKARRNIRLESIYVAILLLGVPILILLFWLEFPKIYFQIDEERYKTLCNFVYAWLGGTFGGVLFVVKWLYHSVAKRIWHLDRRLWRLFTPHISGGLAFAVVLLISSGILQIFDRVTLMTPSVCLSIGFMVGYFSDSAMAKLSEVAETLFGARQKSETIEK